MLDSQGRTIEYLRLSVTDRCNCRCCYCMPADGIPMLSHGDILSFEEMAQMVAAAAALGVRKVRLTGGEPLVRRGVVELVRQVADVPGIEEVALTTNATLLSTLAGPLRQAGLSRLNVSLDSLDAGRYASITRGGRLSEALGGLAAAKEAGFGDTKVNAVLMGGVNDEDVRPLAELAKEGPGGPFGISSVRFIELMPMGECSCWPRSRFVAAEEVLDALPELAPVGTDGVSETYAAPGWQGTVGLIRPMSHKFCRGCSRIRITADGMLKPCLHSSEEIPLRGLTGSALVAAMQRGIARKPEEHRLGMGRGQESQSLRAMNEIGG